jgi:hypothetical protein
MVDVCAPKSISVKEDACRHRCAHQICKEGEQRERDEAGGYETEREGFNMHTGCGCMGGVGLNKREGAGFG